MKISKILQHFTFLMLLFCDLDRAFAAIAYNDDSSIYKLEKLKETVSYVEYHKDHEISEMQARASLRNMKETDFAVPAHCKPCKPEHKKYCHSENLLKDHCCCNMSHSKGEFIDFEKILIIDFLRGIEK